uniref:Uncharacterized protein n=1 Tax=Utricularia reniformis TaxID=192314 RepID=A0A1Y0B407_9LAMI|nr:hypothetical protein AEK19_MT1965 [Utricularia reniformis]ART32128.1 hypothetical protein AEK19_MT1965 [Utricularia reniformis]
MDLQSGTALTVQSEQAGITSRLQFPVNLIDWKLSLEDPFYLQHPILTGCLKQS